MNAALLTILSSGCTDLCFMQVQCYGFSRLVVLKDSASQTLQCVTQRTILPAKAKAATPCKPIPVVAPNAEAERLILSAPLNGGPPIQRFGRFDLDSRERFHRLTFNFRGLLGQEIIGPEAKGTRRGEVRGRNRGRRGRRRQQTNPIKSARAWPNRIGGACDCADGTDGATEIEPANLCQVRPVLNLVAAPNG